MKTVSGVIHGNMIEIKGNLGLPDGEEVEIFVRSRSQRPSSGDGLLRCAGGMAEDWTSEDDRILAEIQQERETTSHRALPE